MTRPQWPWFPPYPRPLPGLLWATILQYFSSNNRSGSLSPRDTDIRPWLTGGPKPWPKYSLRKTTTLNGLSGWNPDLLKWMVTSASCRHPSAISSQPLQDPGEGGGSTKEWTPPAPADPCSLAPATWKWMGGYGSPHLRPAIPGTQGETSSSSARNSGQRLDKLNYNNNNNKHLPNPPGLEQEPSPATGRGSGRAGAARAEDAPRRPGRASGAPGPPAPRRGRRCGEPGAAGARRWGRRRRSRRGGREGGARRPRARTHSPALAALLSPPVRAGAAAPPAPPPPPSALPPPRPGRAPFPLPGAGAPDRRGKPPPAARHAADGAAAAGAVPLRPGGRDGSRRGPKDRLARARTQAASRPDLPSPGHTWALCPPPTPPSPLCPGRLPLGPHTQGDGREPSFKDGMYPFSLGEMLNRPLSLEGARKVLHPLASGCTQSAASASCGNLALQPQACWIGVCILTPSPAITPRAPWRQKSTGLQLKVLPTVDPRWHQSQCCPSRPRFFLLLSAA